MQLITTKPTIYLVNLTMKDYLRQKSKYLPLIAKWVTEHGGLPRDIIPFSIEFEEKLHTLREDPAKLADFLEKSKVKSRLEKIITEGKPLSLLELQLYCADVYNIRFHKTRTTLLFHRYPTLHSTLTNTYSPAYQRARKRSAAGQFRRAA